MSLKSWLVAGLIPGVSRAPLKKLRRMKTAFSGCCIAGRTRRSRPAATSRVWLWALKLVVTVSGVRPEGAYHLWRKVPSRQLSIDLEADERLGWVTGRVEAS